MFGSIVIGMAFAFGWTPCIGPILGSILALAGGAMGISSGMILLAAYSMGLAIPFLLAAWASCSFFKVFQKFVKLLHGIQIGGGIFLVIVGVLIFTGYFTVLNSLFIELTPSWLLEKI